MRGVCGWSLCERIGGSYLFFNESKQQCKSVKGLEGKMKCNKCGLDVEMGAKFCPACGVSMPTVLICPKCHYQCSLTAKFCVECGTALHEVGGVSSHDDRLNLADQHYRFAGNWINNVHEEDDRYDEERDEVWEKLLEAIEIYVCIAETGDDYATRKLVEIYEHHGDDLHENLWDDLFDKAYNVSDKVFKLFVRLFEQRRDYNAGVMAAHICGFNLEEPETARDLIRRVVLLCRDNLQEISLELSTKIAETFFSARSSWIIEDCLRPKAMTIDECKYWYKISMSKGNLMALVRLGNIAEVEDNLKEARAMYEKACRSVSNPEVVKQGKLYMDHLNRVEDLLVLTKRGGAIADKAYYEIYSEYLGKSFGLFCGHFINKYSKLTSWI